MYTILLTLHSLIRWAVLLFGILAVFRSLRGLTGHRPWTPFDDRAGLLYTISLDVQIVLGLILYLFLSPITSAALHDMGAAMSVPTLRFWAVEHVTLMLAALLVAHIGRVRVRKVSDAHTRHRRALIFFAVSLIAALGGIPWPGSANARPLLRFG